MRRIFYKFLTIILLTGIGLSILSMSFGTREANAQICDCGACKPFISMCEEAAIKTSDMQKGEEGGEKSTIPFITEEFIMQREWLIKELFEKHILPALMLFAEQITAMAMHQVVVIGTFLDAKHQLETQRLFNELTARAHKDYHPSEGMCTFGTNIRSLAASDRNVELSAIAFSARAQQRELLSGDAISTNGATSDFTSRLQQFREQYCAPEDNNEGLKLLCPNPKDRERINKDIDYTSTFDQPLTLVVDFKDPEYVEGSSEAMNASQLLATYDEKDVFALAANLYAHDVAPLIPQAFLSDEDGNPNRQASPHYMNIRALAAKRSVARNSFASIVALKSEGAEEVQPYLYAIMKEMGLSDGSEEGGGGGEAENEIRKYLGDKPSYYAQMEVLTKKLYQNPTFYTELYDKPANVERKNVSMQAIELMQKRDIYRSILRSEAILSVMLETALIEQQDKVLNEINRLNENDELVKLPE